MTIRSMGFVLIALLVGASGCLAADESVVLEPAVGGETIALSAPGEVQGAADPAGNLPPGCGCQGHGPGFVDENHDGVCDNLPAGGCPGNCGCQGKGGCGCQGKGGCGCQGKGGCGCQGKGGCGCQGKGGCGCQGKGPGCQGHGRGFVDENHDGVCDHLQSL
ncbi:MAG: hypothetical protein HY744_27150 [Deltaproteobacteria bacterium]|nr:hypothetical protein [Deltaproteobacteria bacterium]